MSDTNNQPEFREIQLGHGRKEVRFLYVNDTHFNATSPKRRIDDMTETSLVKFAEVGRIADERDVDFVLHGGDFFEKPDVTDLYAGRVAKVIRQFKRPVYVIPGGHDLFGNNVESVARTKLGFFERSGLVNLLIHPNRERVIIKGNGISVQLTGTASHFGIDVENIEDDFVIKDKASDFALHMIHGMLMPTPFIPNTPTVTIDQIKHTVADVTMAGHFHLGFDPVYENGRWFANCGAMVRRKADVKELDRMPMVALITFSHAGGASVEYLPLTAKPGDEVLDRSQIEQAQQMNQQRHEFMGQIQQSRMIKSLNVNTIVRDLGQNKKLPQPAVQAAVEAVEKMQQALESGRPEPVKGQDGKWRWIKRVVLHNFKSYEHTEIDLSEGVNAIVGESDKGKTTILRGIKWVLYNEIKGSIFRHGQTEAYVTMELSDGTKVTRGRKKTKNYYIVEYTDGRETFQAENFRDAIPEEVIAATGVMRIQIDTDKEMALNVNGQLEGPFLLSETGTVKAKAIGSIVKTNVIDAAERNVQRELQGATAELRELNAQIETAEAGLVAYADIDKEEANILKMDELVKKLIAVHEAAAKLEYLQKKMDAVEKEVEATEVLLFDLVALPSLEMLYLQLKDLYRTQKQAALIKAKLDQRADEIAQTQAILTSLSALPSLERDTNELEALHRQAVTVRRLNAALDNVEREVSVQKAVLERLTALPDMDRHVVALADIQQRHHYVAAKKTTFDGMDVEIANEKRALEKLAGLSTFEERVKQLEVAKKAYEQASPIVTRLAENEKALVAGREYLATTKKSIEMAVGEYVDALRQHGKCPTCTHDITAAELKNIERELKGDI